MFLATLDICDGWVKTSIHKVNKKGIVSPDRRGKNPKRPKPIKPELKESIKNHIDLIPRISSHYCRSNSSKKYLIEEIQSVAKMYDLYKEWMSEFYPDKQIATIRYYRDIFNLEYNISFFVANKDQCEECTVYKNSNDKEKEKIQDQYDTHLKNKDLAQRLKEADTKVAKLKASVNLSVACFDYEKTLICPKAQVSMFYYKTKLSVSNFTIVDVGTNDNYCYVYDETIANKGSNEVASFLFDFIQTKVDAGVNDFRFYCDNCPGQNENRIVAALFVFAASKFNISIKLRFPEKGHTYNAADTVHSLIERKVKHHDIYTPQQWYDMIRTAKRSELNPIKVIEVKQSMIFDWKDLLAKINLDKDVNGTAVSWKCIREISTVISNTCEMRFKINFDDESVIVSTKKIGRPVNFETYVPRLAYLQPIPISKSKFEDLMYYCNHNLIPEECQNFYRQLLQEENEKEATFNDDQDSDEFPIGRPRKRKRATTKAKRVS